MTLPKILVFASGTPTDGGSGFANLVRCSRSPKHILDAEIVGVVSHHKHGGVREKAEQLGVPFLYFSKPRTAKKYQELMDRMRAEFAALSGWLHMTKGLNPETTFNIHPGDITRFGGKGLYGHYVHKAVLKAYQKGEVIHSAVTMHFVADNGQYDTGPIFFQHPVAIFPQDTPETLAARVNQCEHYWQPYITNLVVHRAISWDGKNPASLRVPEGYLFLPRV